MGKETVDRLQVKGKKRTAFQAAVIAVEILKHFKPKINWFLDLKLRKHTSSSVRWAHTRYRQPMHFKL